MTNQTPATPAPAATPGTGTPGQSPTPPAPIPGQGEANVTISAEEYRNLKRDQGRLTSFQKRSQFARPTPRTEDFSGENPDIVEELRKSREQATQAQRDAFKANVILGVRNILDKPEYAGLPKSTKALILQNPAALSEANNVDEALMDIEDFVRENAFDNSQPNKGVPGQPAPTHEVPPVHNAAAQVPTAPADLEDTSKLSGPARSRAVLRNALKKASGGAK